MPRRGRKTDYAWLNLDDVLNAFTSNALAIIGTLSFTGPGTIHRVRGGEVSGFFVASAASDLATIVLALGIVSTDAATAGVGSMPAPFGDTDYPWMWWKSFTLSDSDASGGQGVLGMHYFRTEIETKAMRIVKPKQSLVLVAQYIDAVGTPPITVVHSGSRVLLGV